MNDKTDIAVILSENKLRPPISIEEIPHVISLFLILSSKDDEVKPLRKRYNTKKDVNCIRPSIPSKKHDAATPQKITVLYFPKAAHKIARPKGEAPGERCESPRRNARHRKKPYLIAAVYFLFVPSGTSEYGHRYRDITRAVERKYALAF